MNELFEDVQYKIKSLSMLDLEIRNGDSYEEVYLKKEKQQELDILINMLPSTEHISREY